MEGTTALGAGVVGVFLAAAGGAVGFLVVGLADCEEDDVLGVDDFPTVGGVSGFFVVFGTWVDGDLVTPDGGVVRTPEGVVPGFFDVIGVGVPDADLAVGEAPGLGIGSGGVVRWGRAVARRAGLESVVAGDLLVVDGTDDFAAGLVEGIGSVSALSAGGEVSVPEAGTMVCAAGSSGSDVAGSTPPAGTTRWGDGIDDLAGAGWALPDGGGDFAPG